tara:strand:- start:487 stop:828 length:342 start_codon:yes stop_codon:yes gene_type:complete
MNLKAVMTTISKYIGGYLLGILASLFFTPAQTILAGVFMIPIYVMGALPGFFLWFVIMVQEPNIIAIFSLVVLGPIYGEWRLRQLAGDAEVYDRTSFFCSPKSLPLSSTWPST